MYAAALEHTKRKAQEQEAEAVESASRQLTEIDEAERAKRASRKDKKENKEDLQKRNEKYMARLVHLQMQEAQIQDILMKNPKDATSPEEVQEMQATKRLQKELEVFFSPLPHGPLQL